MFFLLNVSSQPGVYYAYLHSDAVGKGIVLLLLGMSILTWCTMVDKIMSVFRAKKHAQRFSAVFRSNSKNIATPALRRDADNDCGPTAAIYSAGVSKLMEFYEAQNKADSLEIATVSPCRLSEEQLNAIEAVLEREVSSQIEILENRIGLLATLVSLSPFCGLFGTVWGVMMAFCGIAAAGKSDFTALAPGVAGALLTTVAGLVVAIPSLIGYNILTSTVRGITVTMDNFTEEFMVRLKLEQLQLNSRNN